MKTDGIQREVSISFVGAAHSGFVPPGCRTDRVSLFALIKAKGREFYLWKPLPDLAFTDPLLMQGLKDALRIEALNFETVAWPEARGR